MPYLTREKNLKQQLSPGLVASYDIQPGNGVGLFWDTTHTPDPHGGRWLMTLSVMSGARVLTSSVLLSLAELNDANTAVDAARQKLQQVENELSTVKPLAAKYVICYGVCTHLGHNLIIIIISVFF